MKRLMVLLVFVLIIGCSRVQVIKPGEQYVQAPQATQPLPSQKEPSSVIENVTAQNNRTYQKTVQTVESSIGANDQTISSFNPTNEYHVTECCSEGRLYATTTKGFNEYTKDDIKQILLDAYHSNCANLKGSIREFIYLKFFEGDYDAYLIHYKNTTVKKILIKGELIDQSFSTCS